MLGTSWEIFEGEFFMLPWHVLRVRSPFEDHVCRSGLCAAGVLGFSPMYRHEVTKAVRPLLPGYVFARFETRSAETWHLIRDTQHVMGFITEDDMWPAPVLDPVVDYWYSSADAEGIVPLEARRTDVLRGFGVGDILTIGDGPFAGHNGLCLWVDERGARIEIALLGRTIGLYAPLASVKSALDAQSGVSVAASYRSKARRLRRKRLQHRLGEAADARA